MTSPTSSPVGAILNRIRGGSIAEGLTVDDMLHAVTGYRRRFVIQRIGDNPTTIGELTDALAAIEYGDGYDASERKAVYVSLYQNHLPALREYGIAVGEGDGLRAGANRPAAIEVIRAVAGRVGGEAHPRGATTDG